MKLPFLIQGNEILTRKASEITENDESLKRLISDMYETLGSTIGCGLSAPQIGQSLRLFIVDADKMSGFYPECKDFKRTFINPRIVKTSRDTSVLSEGCLSVPGIMKEVRRPNKVTLEYLDENFSLHKEKFYGFNARIILHECDHLEGKLMTDYK